MGVKNQFKGFGESTYRGKFALQEIKKMEFRMNLRTRLRIDRGTQMNRCVIKHS